MPGILAKYLQSNKSLINTTMWHLAEWYSPQLTQILSYSSLFNKNFLF